jgi:hypothetical protein
VGSNDLKEIIFIYHDSPSDKSQVIYAKSYRGIKGIEEAKNTLEKLLDSIQRDR